MIISRNQTITDEQYNNLDWSELPPTPENLTAVFAGREIISAETIDFPLTDGIIFALLDGEQIVFVETSIDDNLLYGNIEDCETPLFLRVSEPVLLEPTPA